LTHGFRIKNRQGGFTLIEVVVVIAVIGIILGMMTVSLRPNDSQLLHEEAKRIAFLLEMTQEEAMTTGEALGWSFTADGEYHFWNLGNEGKWKRAADDDFFHEGSLDKRVRLVQLSAGGINLKA